MLQSAFSIIFRAITNDVIFKSFCLSFIGLELFSNTNAKFFGRFINDKRVSIGRFIINNENDSYYYFGYVKGIHAEGFGWHENAKKEIYYEGMWSNSRKDGIGI